MLCSCIIANRCWYIQRVLLPLDLFCFPCHVLRMTSFLSWLLFFRSCGDRSPFFVVVMPVAQLNFALRCSRRHRDAKASRYARFLRDPTGIAAPSTDCSGSSSGGGGEGQGQEAAQQVAASAENGGLETAAAAAASAAMAVAARGAGAGGSRGVGLDVVAIGEDLSDEVSVYCWNGGGVALTVDTCFWLVFSSRLCKIRAAQAWRAGFGCMVV